MSMHKKLTIYLAMLTIVSMGVYFNSLFNKFAFDDIHIVEKNPLVKDSKNIFRLFKEEYGAETAHKDSQLYRPLVMATYLVTYVVFGDSPFWMHLGNVLLHTLNVLAVFFLCKRLIKIFPEKTEPEQAAFFCGLFFAVHPVCVESVAGIVGRAELMSGFFCLMSFLFYLERKPFFSLLFFLCGLLSKETAISLFPLIILFELLFNKQLPGLILGYAAVILCYIPIRLIALGGIISSNKIFYFKEGILTRIFTMSKVMVYYIKLMFVPYPLNPDWGVSEVIVKSDSLGGPYVLVSIAAVFIIFFIGYRFLKTKPVITFSLLWFFVFLLPVSNIIPIGDLMAERFLYLPVFGFCLFAGTTVCRYKVLKKTVPVILLILATITVKQNPVWKDNSSLWTHVTEKFPENWRAYWELGKCYRDKENYSKTVELFKKSLAIRETDLVLFDYGNVLRRQKRPIEALKIFDKYMKINNSNSKVYLETAKCFSETGDYKKAEYNFKTAILLSPKDDNVFYEIGRFYLTGNDLPPAKKHFENTLVINKNNAGALVGLGVYYFRMKELDKAKNYFAAAQKIEPNHPEAFYNLIVVNIELGEKDRAEQLFGEFKKLFPNDGKIKQIEKRIYEKI